MRFKRYEQIPSAFWNIARRCVAGETITIPCGTMQKAVNYRAEWYHARAWVRANVPQSDAQAGDWLAIQNVSATIRGSNLAFAHAPGDLTFGDLFGPYMEPTEVAEPLAVEPEPTQVGPVTTAQESAVESWFNERSEKNKDGAGASGEKK